MSTMMKYDVDNLEWRKEAAASPLIFWETLKNREESKNIIQASLASCAGDHTKIWSPAIKLRMKLTKPVIWEKLGHGHRLNHVYKIWKAKCKGRKSGKSQIYRGCRKGLSLKCNTMWHIEAETNKTSCGRHAGTNGRTGVTYIKHRNMKKHQNK